MEKHKAQLYSAIISNHAVHAGRLEAVFVMQTAEDRGRRNTVAVWQPMPG
jgi:hypothetical protein